MTGSEGIMTADKEERQRKTIRRTAIVLGVLAFAWYLGFMLLRLM